jgi:hypothetical protein
MQSHQGLTQSAEKAAIGLSFICALHCVLFPVAVVILPSAALFGFNDEWFHRLLLLVVLPVSAFALFSGSKRHQNKSVLGLGITGLVILTVGAGFGHEVFGETGERFISVVGSLLVAVSHLRNLKLCLPSTSKIDSD